MRAPSGVPWLAELLAQAAAAGFGAWAAFRFESRQRTAQESEDRADAIRRVLFGLLCQRNHLLRIEESSLRGKESDVGRFITIPPLYIGPPPAAIDAMSLTFLLKTKQSGILSNLDEANGKFETAVGVLESRNQLHQQAQDKLDRSGFASGETTVGQIQTILGPRLSAQLKLTTDALFELTRAAVILNRSTYDRVQATFKLVFPKLPLPNVIERAMDPDAT